MVLAKPLCCCILVSQWTSPYSCCLAPGYPPVPCSRPFLAATAAPNRARARSSGLSDCVPGPVRDVSRDPDPLFGSEGCGLATLSGVISDKAGPIIVDGQRQFSTWALAERQLASPGF
jgi:hypothetical protein